jgi:hypothetical protein
MYHVTLTLLPHELTEDKRAYLFYHNKLEIVVVEDITKVCGY